MASIQHETEQQESDDDCEVYFLKPGNEYNIVDKIKEANMELFSDEAGVGKEAQQNRKVKFAANLEEYEPLTGINLNELEVKLGIDCKEDNEEGNLQKIKIDKKLEIIVEETTTANEFKINEGNATDSKKMEKDEEKESFNVAKELEAKENISESKQIQISTVTTNFSKEDDDTILEEICEEILIMDMENDKLEQTSVTKFDSPGTMQRKMLKQITFDYTEEDEDSDLDNQSLTNLLVSDNENDINDNWEYNCNESINDDTDTEDKLILKDSEFYEDDVDDDKLSIIVASYLRDDMACDKTSLTSSNIKSSSRPDKSRNLPFNKRFSFRRKTKSSNAIGSCSNHHYVSSNRRFIPPPEVTDLKLHYKTCCDFKNVPQNLPKYSGYISEYGLSREQLLERERKLQQKQHGKIVETLKTSEGELRKVHDNERAFTTWLKNKMRYPINKTRNMFDVKRPFGLRKCAIVGGNGLSDDTKHILNTNKYRSISAKLNKKI